MNNATKSHSSSKLAVIRDDIRTRRKSEKCLCFPFQCASQNKALVDTSLAP